MDGRGVEVPAVAAVGVGEDRTAALPGSHVGARGAAAREIGAEREEDHGRQDTERRGSGEAHEGSGRRGGRAGRRVSASAERLSTGVSGRLVPTRARGPGLACPGERFFGARRPPSPVACPAMIRAPLRLSAILPLLPCCLRASPPPAAPPAPTAAPTAEPSAEPAPAAEKPATALSHRVPRQDREALPASPDFVKRLCGGFFPDVALQMLSKGTPWTRGYLRVKSAEAWNASGGVSSGEKIVFDEELVVLTRREAATGGMTVSGAGGGYDVLRWDGSCASLQDEEVTLNPSPSPKAAKVPLEAPRRQDPEGHPLRREAEQALPGPPARVQRRDDGRRERQVREARRQVQRRAGGLRAQGGNIPLPSRLPWSRSVSSSAPSSTSRSGQPSGSCPTRSSRSARATSTST